MFLIYPILFFFLWALFYLSSPGFLVAALTLSGFAVYHTRLIDDNYEQLALYSLFQVAYRRL